MTNTINPTLRNPEPDFAACVAMDWGDAEHAWAIQAGASGTVETGTLKHTPETIHQWVLGLRQRFHAQPIAVSLEQSRGPLVFILSKYPELHLFPIPPAMSSRFHGALHPSGSSSDKADALSQLALLLHHRDRLRRFKPDTPDTRELQFLVEDRRTLVDEKTAASNRLTATLKDYYPQVLVWFKDVDSPMALDFLQQWPSLDKLQRVRRATVEKFLTTHQSVDAELNQKRLDSMFSAINATNDAAVINASLRRLATFVQRILQLREQISGYDKRIAELTEAHQDHAIFSSFPMAGPAMLPRLIAAFGTDRDRYSTADDVQCYCGIAPIIQQSGNFRVVQFRYACPKFLRQTFHEWAALTIRKSAWAAAYYHSLRQNKKDHHAAVRALAFKWIRILFRCWKTRTPYDECKYHQSLQANNTKLIAAMAALKSL